VDKRIIEISRTYAYFAAPRLAIGFWPCDLPTREQVFVGPLQSSEHYASSSEHNGASSEHNVELDMQRNDDGCLLSNHIDAPMIDAWDRLMKSRRTKRTWVGRTRSRLTAYSLKRLFALSRVTFAPV